MSSAVLMTRLADRGPIRGAGHLCGCHGLAVAQTSTYEGTGGMYRKVMAGIGLVAVFAAFSLVRIRVLPAMADVPSISTTCDTASLAYCVDGSTLGDGGTLDVAGVNFPISTEVVVWVDTNGNGVLDANEPSKEGKSDGSGVLTDGVSALSVPLQVRGVPAGAYQVQVGLCPTLGAGATDPCAVTPSGTSPQIIGLAHSTVTVNLGATPDRIGGGSTVTVTGFGFPPGANVNVWIDANSNKVLDSGETTLSQIADPGGAFSVVFPSAAGGVNGSPGTVFIDASTSTTASATTSVDIGTCWFQDCIIDGADTICLMGNSPHDSLSFLADCKQVDSNYSDPVPATAANIPPGGYDLSNVGPIFLGAGQLAAAATDFSPLSACPSMQAAIKAATVIYGYPNMGDPGSVPDAGLDELKYPNTLLDIACGTGPSTASLLGIGGLPPQDLALYVANETVARHATPDSGVVASLLAIIKAAEVLAAGAIITAGFVSGTVGPALAAVAGSAASAGAVNLGMDAVTAAALGASIAAFLTTASFAAQLTSLLLAAAVVAGVELFVQTTLDQAAVSGALACGYVDGFCKGQDITENIITHPDLQQRRIPDSLLQMSAPNPNPCPSPPGGRCWGDVIGWSKVKCHNLPPDTSSCEAPGVYNNYPGLAYPGSAGIDNADVPTMCATGTVEGLSIGYDGDVGFDLWDDPSILNLVNYHNFSPGPGGTPPPNGIDVEIPPFDRGPFIDAIKALRVGTRVRVCGQWVADMHMLWNELHPVSSLEVLSTVAITSPKAEAQLPSGAMTVTAAITDPGISDSDTCMVAWDKATPVTGTMTVAPTVTSPGTCTAATSGLSEGPHTVTVAAVDPDSTQTPSATVGFTVANGPPVLVLPGTQAVQYSDSLMFPVGATDPDPADTVTLAASGLPAGLSFADNGDRTGTISGVDTAPAGSYPVTITANDGINPPVAGTVTINVNHEDAVVSMPTTNPSAVQTTVPGGAAGPLTFRATISNGVDDATPGDISLATPVSFSLIPLGGGTTYSCSGTTLSAPVAGIVTAACTFPAGTAVNVYLVQVTIGGSYYTGSADGVLAVYDPSLGFATGGGTIKRNGLTASFGFTAKYLKSGQLQGNLIYIEHDALGDLILKSNAMGSLVIYGGTTAYLSGKATFGDVGNYSFRATAIDNGPGGSTDQFGLSVTSSSGTPVAGLTFNPVTLAGGNITVPHHS